MACNAAVDALGVESVHRGSNDEQLARFNHPTAACKDALPHSVQSPLHTDASPEDPLSLEITVKATFYSRHMPMMDYDDSGDLLCGYASKKCFNARTTKKGGGLHRFCEFHRCRANRNQWRVDNKRRALRAQRRQQLKRLQRSSASGADAEAALEPMRRERGTHLTTEDIELLQVMLLNDDDDGQVQIEDKSASLNCAAVEFIL